MARVRRKMYRIEQEGNSRSSIRQPLGGLCNDRVPNLKISGYQLDSAWSRALSTQIIIDSIIIIIQKPVLSKNLISRIQIWTTSFHPLSEFHYTKFNCFTLKFSGPKWSPNWNNYSPEIIQRIIENSSEPFQIVQMIPTRRSNVDWFPRITLDSLNNSASTKSKWRKPPPSGLI